MKKILPYSMLIFLLCSCKKESNLSCTLENNQLRKKVDFPVGVVVDPYKLNALFLYEQIVNDQFNSITAENIMKPANLHPLQNVFEWGLTDELANYCLANDKRFHGHTLIWHQQLPNWMLNFQGSPSEWDNMFKNHIQTIVGHYKGKVASWDVINEAFNENGTLRSNIWLEHIGPSYIEKAFRYAKEADPNAKLFYNDYSLVINATKRNAVLKYMKQLKSNGVPIDGIGLQMHLYNGFPENFEISQAIDEVWRSDFLVHISELDISINPLSLDMSVPSQIDLNLQADKFMYVFKTFQSIPEIYQFGITVWGVSDADSWIRYFYDRDDYPLLFDDDYQPKAAYCKLIKNL